MKYCPNPECPYALRHHEGQEYRDEAVTCADCGAALVAQPQSFRPRTPRDEWAWARLAVTVAAPLLLLWLGPMVPLPRVDRAAFENMLSEDANRLVVSVFALGLSPMMGAFLLVELAVLCVPRWRPLRTGGPSGRARLAVAAGWLTLGLAFVQGLWMSIPMEKVRLLEPEVRLSRLVVVFSLAAGSFLLVALAAVLDRVALGGGVSVLVTALTLAGWRVEGAALWRDLARAAQASNIAGLVPLLLVVAGTVFVLRWRPAAGSVGPRGLPLPACGLVPLLWGPTLAAVAVVLARSGVAREWMLDFAFDRPTPVLSGTLTLTAVLAVAFGFLFYRPSKVAAFVPGDAMGLVGRAVAVSTAYVLGVAVLGQAVTGELALVARGLVPILMAVAVVLDVLAEALATVRHGPLAAVWPEHRLYAVDGALAALAGRGIPALARSVHHRALWHFFAPFIPIQLMVPAAQAEDAREVLRRHFGLEEPADGLSPAGTSPVPA
jgi:SecY translocase